MHPLNRARSRAASPLLVACACACACLGLSVVARAQDDPVSQALRAADDLAEEGRFAAAVDALEREQARLAALDPEGWAAHGPRTLAQYRAIVPEERRFEGALEAAARGQTGALEAWVREVEAGGYKLVGYAFVDRWRARARRALGGAAYQRIVTELEGEALQAMPLDEVLRGDPEAEVEGPTVGGPTVRARGSAGRRAAARARAEVDREALERARAQVAAVDSARAAREAAASARARGAAVGGGILAGRDAQGFTLRRGGVDEAACWDEAEAALAVDVRALGVSPDDARGLHDLALFALTRGRFDRAERALAQAAAVDSAWARPDLDLPELRRRAAPFRAAAVDLTAAPRVEVAWAFDHAREALDMTPASAATTVEVTSGALHARCATSAALVRARGSWDDVRVDLTPAALDPPALVGLSGRAARLFVEVSPARARLLVVGRDREVEVARADHAGARDLRVEASVERQGQVERLRVRLLLGGRVVLTHEVPWTGPLEVMLGAGGREARLGAVTIAGALTPGWLERAAGAGLGEVVRAVAGAEAARGRQGLPVAYRRTSAEDAVGLQGVSDEAQALLAEGRDLVRQGQLDHALRSFEAARDRAPTCAAALYLSGRARLDLGDVQGALERADAADALVEDFHEAWTLRAAACLRRVRLDAAAALLRRAAALAPASPLGWRTRADLLTRQGDRAGARAALALAAALAPDDRDLAAAAARAAAVATPPRVSGELRSGALALLADLPAGELRLLGRLPEELGRLPRVLAAALPTLAARPPPPERPLRVVLLDSPATFHRWLAARGVAAAPEDVSFADPAAGDVVVLREPGHSLQRLRRALVLVWLEEQGAVGLPPWVREGLALCFGEQDRPALAPSPSLSPTTPERLDQLRTLAVGWSRRPSFFDLASGVRRPPELALPELERALAFALFARCLTPGARAERFEGGQALLADLLADYLARLARPAGGSARLEHAWVETFHTLDRRGLEEGLLDALEPLAALHQVPWPEDE